jgi:hypothetical protein
VRSPADVHRQSDGDRDHSSPNPVALERTRRSPSPPSRATRTHLAMLPVGCVTSVARVATCPTEGGLVGSVPSSITQHSRHPCWCIEVDKDRDAGSTGIVGHERLPLFERPVTKRTALGGTGLDPFAGALEVLKADATTEALGPQRSPSRAVARDFVVLEADDSIVVRLGRVQVVRPAGPGLQSLRMKPVRNPHSPVRGSGAAHPLPQPRGELDVSN